MSSTRVGRNVLLESFDGEGGNLLKHLEDHPVAEDIACGCCYEEVPFKMMVQCADGHLICFQCMEKYVEEYTFGNFQARSSLPCLDTSGCMESFSLSEIRRILPNDVLERYEQRQAQEDFALAKLEDLASCIRCKEPSHMPLSCEEVEKTSETALRRRIEEAMTQAVIRVCNSCKIELVKVDGGCNKVKCRCGTTMCYKCRQTISSDYSHFCKHVRDLGRRCHVCSKCGLWETEIEDNVALAAREKALKELAVKDTNLLSQKIGPNISTVHPGNTNRPAHQPFFNLLHQRNAVGPGRPPIYPFIHQGNAYRPAFLHNLHFLHQGNGYGPAFLHNAQFMNREIAYGPAFLHNVHFVHQGNADRPAHPTSVDFVHRGNAGRFAPPHIDPFRHVVNANLGARLANVPFEPAGNVIWVGRPANNAIVHPGHADRPEHPDHIPFFMCGNQPANGRISNMQVGISMMNFGF